MTRLTHYFPAIAFFAGFLWDALTLGRYVRATDLLILSAYLLKTFINAQNLDDKVLLWQTVIHMTFVASAIAIAYIDKLLSHSNEH